MSFSFGEQHQGFDAMLAAVQADPDQSWRDKASDRYAEVMLVRAGRLCASLARRFDVPDAKPTTNDVKGAVDLLWDAMAVLSAGKLHPRQQEQAEALWRILKRAEVDGEATRASSDAETSEEKQ